MNLDQTPLKYIPAMHHTMAKQNSKSVSIAGSSDKRTFTITLNGHFLLMQLIYGGKQSKAPWVYVSRRFLTKLQS